MRRTRHSSRRLRATTSRARGSRRRRPRSPATPIDVDDGRGARRDRGTVPSSDDQRAMPTPRSRRPATTRRTRVATTSRGRERACASERRRCMSGVDFAILTRCIVVSDREAQRRTRGSAPICLHAGQEPDPVDRRHHHADLSDVDLRAGRARPAQGLRVRAHAEPDARWRSSATSPRSKAGSAAFAFASAWRPSAPSRRCSKPAITSSCPTTSTAARSGCSTRCSRRYQLTFTYVDTGRSRRGRARVHAGDADAVRRDAEQPDDAAHRPARGRRRSRTATARGSSSTTRSPARACSGRSSSAPTS